MLAPPPGRRARRRRRAGSGSRRCRLVVVVADQQGDGDTEALPGVGRTRSRPRSTGALVHLPVALEEPGRMARSAWLTKALPGPAPARPCRRRPCCPRASPVGGAAEQHHSSRAIGTFGRIQTVTSPAGNADLGRSRSSQRPARGVGSDGWPRQGPAPILGQLDGPGSRLLGGRARFIGRSARVDGPVASCSGTRLVLADIAGSVPAAGPPSTRAMPRKRPARTAAWDSHWPKKCSSSRGGWRCDQIRCQPCGSEGVRDRCPA